ncbi:hypothetical protein T459_22909 [Capsicum annuum]|uniref:Uncharacterized protein n=1 Tax=Capsicum annuum TaxID=4072 RepID=A0A2G2YQZ4_CAPAN|nr:hypothetical protein T459_22909 [Capsicum annuum]
MSSFTATTPNFDNLLLQSLMNRLQIRSPSNSPSPQCLEDLLFNTLPFSSEDDDDNDKIDLFSSQAKLSKEESLVEKEIIRIILTGNVDSLMPNSGQAVVIGEHHICIGFHEDTGSDYRVWEWHGHIMLFDEENGYMPEYIYGNYFERVNGKIVKEKRGEEESEKEEKIGNLGLRELIQSGETNNEGRILRRNINAGSTRFITESTLFAFFFMCV